MSNQKIITIVGRSNSGKTTLVEKIVAHYSDKGLRVSVLKHIRHEFSMDHPGKDTYRFKDAGAYGSMITNGSQLGIVSDVDDRDPLLLIEKYFADSDLVIIEGYKEGDTRKIEVIGDSEEVPLFRSSIKNIIIVVSDKVIETKNPSYKRDDIKGIIKGIEKYIF